MTRGEPSAGTSQRSCHQAHGQREAGEGQQRHEAHQSIGDGRGGGEGCDGDGQARQHDEGGDPKNDGHRATGGEDARFDAVGASEQRDPLDVVGPCTVSGAPQGDRRSPDPCDPDGGSRNDGMDFVTESLGSEIGDGEGEPEGQEHPGGLGEAPRSGGGQARVRQAQGASGRGEGLGGWSGRHEAWGIQQRKGGERQRQRAQGGRHHGQAMGWRLER